jgi:hypothetical protein
LIAIDKVIHDQPFKAWNLLKSNTRWLKWKRIEFDG